MGMIGKGYEFGEGFYFSDGWEIHINFTSDMPPIKYDGKLIMGSRKVCAKFRRVSLYKNNKIISSIIEVNPDYLDSDLRTGENIENKFNKEFIKIFKFPNDYTAKMEYLPSVTESESYRNIYKCKYYQATLFNENKEIISERVNYNSRYVDESKEYDFDPDTMGDIV